MNAVAELTEALIAAGMTPGEAAGLLARAHAEMAVPARSKGAIRTARWRENRASQTVTERHSVTPEIANTETSPIVTNRHKASQCDVSLSLREVSKKEKIKKERRAEQLGDGWRPQPVDWQTSIDQLEIEGAEIELQKFTDHARMKGRTAKDWNAAWRNWVRQAIEYRGGRNGQRNNGPQSNGRRSSADDFFAGIASVAENLDRDGAMARPAASDVPRGRFEIDGSGTPGGDDGLDAFGGSHQVGRRN